VPPVLYLRLTLIAALFILAPVHAAPARIVAIGDVHGASAELATILQRAGLIDAADRWIGGTATLVQNGDLTDRGAGVRAVLDRLMALEPQAAAAGGRVQLVLGNHEVMNMIGETRDLTPEIFRSFADGQSESRRERAFDAATRLKRQTQLDKAQWLAEHPIGFVEYREAFQPNGLYGRWLRSKPVVAEIDGTVFMHGGVNAAFTSGSLDDINRRAQRELTDWDAGVRWLERQKLVLPFSSLMEVVDAARSELARFSAYHKEGMLTNEQVRAVGLLTPITAIGESSILHTDGPLWFRGFSTWTDEAGAPLMAALLAKYRVKRFVTGHTPQASGRIRQRFGGTLFLIDTGMLGGSFYPGGRPSALEITGDAVRMIYDETTASRR
jgi:hypothetical protein